MRAVVFALFAALLLPHSLHAETIELVTYFPAGNAANNQDLRVRTLAVGNDYAAVVLPDGHALFSGGVFTRGGNGDFNGDGTLSPLDGLGVINYLNAVTGLPTPEQYARADISGDGRLSAIDSQLIADVLNGTRTLAQAQTVGRTIMDRAFGPIINGDIRVGVATFAATGSLDVAGDLFVRELIGSNNHVRIRGPSDGNTAIELRSETGPGGGVVGTPYIDFANDAATDFDMRLQMTGNDTLVVTGGNLRTIGNQNTTLPLLGVSNTNNGNQAVTDFRVGQDVETGNGQYGALNYYSSGVPANFQGYGNPNQVSLVAAAGATNGLTIATNANAPIKFLTNSSGLNNERMRITGDGRVLIGTTVVPPTAPTTAFVVRRDADEMVFGRIENTNNSANAAARMFVVSQQSNTPISIGIDSFSQNFDPNLLGNFAPGSTAVSTFATFNVGGVNMPANRGNLFIASRGPNQRIAFHTGSTLINAASEAMRITAARRVGIGRDPTLQIFEVQGNAGKTAGGNIWGGVSDARAKQNIQPLQGALSKMLDLRGVTFEWKDPSKHGGETGTRMGFVAQEVERVFPQWVSEDAKGMKWLTPAGFDALSLESIRELNRRIDQLEAENDALKQRIETLEKKQNE